MRFVIACVACISGFGIVGSSTLELHPIQDTATSSIYLAPAHIASHDGAVVDPRPPRNRLVIKGLLYSAPLEAAVVWKTLQHLNLWGPKEEHPSRAINQEWYLVPDTEPSNTEPSKTLLLVGSVGSVVAIVVLVLLVIVICRFTSSKSLAKSNTLTAQPRLVKLAPVAHDLEAGVVVYPPEVTTRDCDRRQHSTSEPEVERPKPSDSKEPLETTSIGASVDGSALDPELRMQTPDLRTPRRDVTPSSNWLAVTNKEECERVMMPSPSEESLNLSRNNSERIVVCTDTVMHRMQTPGVQPSKGMQRGVTPSSKWLMKQNEIDEYSHVLMGTDSDNEVCDEYDDDDGIRLGAKIVAGRGKVATRVLEIEANSKLWGN